MGIWQGSPMLFCLFAPFAKLSFFFLNFKIFPCFFLVVYIFFTLSYFSRNTRLACFGRLRKSLPTLKNTKY
ncbi:MAG: hypothetical protein EAZ95_11390 [Bacteroidetes bacterium]|nr:MAG: hypothetical protein EAZ95_11390 [Bacteroidota bacterium]